MFDKILLDAPCSGSGVLARRADLRWSRKPGDLIQAQALQLRLLENLAGFLRDKGVLVYSTCSIEPEENWETVQMFLERHPHFSVDTAVKYVDQRYCDQKGAVMVLPFEHKLTGSFAIRLVKN
jgi:16S rRNA (cytosine967-C5)-methyltransferase